MTRIKLTTMSPDWPWARQTPGGRGEWGDASFVIDQFGAPADWWFIFDDLPREESIQSFSGNAVLITPEPPALKQYPARYVAQFDYVITSDRTIDHPRKIHTQQGLPWHVGRNQSAGKNLSFSKSYDELKALWPIEKTKLISVIASDKRHTPGHRARFSFVENLKAFFGDRIEVFGWGGREIPDKWDGIAPFRYHIAIENSAQPDYWTEKLSDALLAGAFPIYYGAPNIHSYFPADSVEVININYPKTALQIINDMLARDPYDAHNPKHCRDLVLDKYNLFPVMAQFAKTTMSRPPIAATRTLLPISAFAEKPTILQRAINRLTR